MTELAQKINAANEKRSGNMLNTLRKGAATWVAKIFMGLLVVSFGIWGIADIFRGYGQGTLVKVGEIEISPQEYEHALQTQLKRLSQQLGQQISGEQARAFGLDRQVLNSLITNAALDQQALSLGLGMSDTLLREEIQNIDAFKGEDGKFDRRRYLEILRNNNLNEAMFVREQRVAAIREQLVSTIAAGSHVPSALTDAVNHYDNDKRTVDYFILPRSAVSAIKDPDDAQQKAYLQAHPQQFTAPETRKLGVLGLSADEVRKSVTVSDAEVASEYQARIDQFTTPGKRHLQRMSFLDREKAGEAKKELDAGGDFMQVAEKLGFKKAGTDLGFVDRADISDQAVANAAFSLKVGEVSQPLQGDLATVIVKVVGIDPNQVVKPLDQVKEQLRDAILAERATEKMSSLQDNIEDARAGGQTLQEVATSMSLAYKVTEAVDRSGNGPDGKPVAGLAKSPKLLAAAFESDVGIDNDPVEGDGDSLYWFDVLGVTPERLKSLDEVRAEVVTAWKAEEMEKAHARLAAETLDAINKGKSLADVAKTYKATVKQTKPFTRGEEHDDLPASAITQAFAQPVGGLGMALLDKDRGRVIFRVAAKTAAPAPDKDAADKLQRRLAEQLQGDQISEFLGGLRNSYGVSVNQQMLQRLSGAAD
jgi:peptidyl-prolyl cis-trans isomerase D